MGSDLSEVIIIFQEIMISIFRRLRSADSNLKTGDILEGHTRIKTQQEKFSALLYLTKVNGYSPMELLTRSSFERHDTDFSK